MATRVRYPDGNLLLRNLTKNYPIVSHGKGISLYDQEGNRYLDAVGGAMVVSVGHGNKEVIERFSEHLKKVAYVNGTQFTSDPAEELATKLAGEATGVELDRCFFLCSGSEAIEAAIKFSRQLWVDRGKKEKYKVIARTPGYHGNTLFALSASGRPHYQRYYGPLLNDVIMIDAPYRAYSKVEDYDKDGADFYASQLEKAITEEGPDTVAAFMVEPIIGSSAGGSVPPPGYFDRITEICRKYGVLIIVDEVLSGAGRTGKFFASDHFGLKPDVAVLGKGLAGGYAPLSCVMIKTETLDELKRGAGSFMHAQTYLHSPAITAAGLAVYDYMKENRLVENASKMGDLLHRELRDMVDVCPAVKSCDGLGLLAGVEFAKPTGLPFDRKEKVTERFVQFAFDRGLIVWPNVGSADGTNGDLIMLAPPLIVTEAEVRDLVSQLKNIVLEFFK